MVHIVNNGASIQVQKFNMSKILRFNMTIRKYNMVYSVNNGASIQVQLDLFIAEIYLDQHFKS